MTDQQRLERLYESVEVDEEKGCWLWQRAKDKRGYGVFGLASKRFVAAHRASWILLKGEVPTGLFVLHRCDVPACVNPDHLFLGTQRDNILDMIAKGRRGKPFNKYGGNSKLTSDQAEEIRQRRSGGESPTKLAKEFGVAYTTIWSISTGRLKHIRRVK